MDISTKDTREYEDIAKTRQGNRELKIAGFEHMMDRTQRAMKRASTEGDYESARKMREFSIDTLNKYKGTNYKS